MFRYRSRISSFEYFCSTRHAYAASRILRSASRSLVEQQVLHELLGDGGASLAHLTGRDVHEHGPHQALRVDALVVVEVLVLDREHGVDDVLRHLADLERLSVLGLEDVDLVPGGVEDDRAAGQLGERREVGGLHRVGRDDLGDLRHHGHTDRGQPEGGHDHGDGEAEQGLHVAAEGTRLPPRDRGHGAALTRWRGRDRGWRRSSAASASHDSKLTIRAYRGAEPGW